MLDLAMVREQFPALARQDVYFDNPGGAPRWLSRSWIG